MTAYRTLLGEYAYDWLPREWYGHTISPITNGCRNTPQRRYFGVAPRLSRRGRRYDWVAEDLTEDEEGVHLAIAPRAGADRMTVCADYVIGCDGSRSMVRERAGITQTRSDHDRLMVLLVFRSTDCTMFGNTGKIVLQRAAS